MCPCVGIVFCARQGQGDSKKILYFRPFYSVPANKPRLFFFFSALLVRLPTPRPTCNLSNDWPNGEPPAYKIVSQFHYFPSVPASPFVLGFALNPLCIQVEKKKGKSHSIENSLADGFYKTRSENTYPSLLSFYMDRKIDLKEHVMNTSKISIQGLKLKLTNNLNWYGWY